MKRLALVWMMMMFCASAAWSQETTEPAFVSDEDSLSLPPMQLVPSDMGLSRAVFPEFKLRQPLSSTSTSQLSTTYELNQKFNFRQYNQKNYLLRWDGGRLTGYNSIQSMPGIGGIATAGVTGIHHFSDRLTLTGGAMLQKTGILYNTATLHAQLTYELSDYASVSTFGIYQAPSFFSMYQTPAQGLFGAYLTFHTEDKKWGIDLGEKTEMNPYNGRLEATPIVMPYYNLQGQKLGFDFGGLLKGLFMNYRMNQMMKKGTFPPMGPMGPMGPMPPN